MVSKEKKMEIVHLACSKDIQNLETKMDASVRHPVKTCYITVVASKDTVYNALSRFTYKYRQWITLTPTPTWSLYAYGSQKSTLGAFPQQPLTLVFETRSLIRTRTC